MSIHPCPVPRCRDRNDPDGNPPLISTPLCEHHTRRVTVAVAEAPTVYAALGEHIGIPSQRAASDHVTVSKTPPVPINVEVRSLQEALARLLAEVEDDHRHARGFSRHRFLGREAYRVDRGARFVDRHLDAILEAEYGVLFALDLLRLVSDTRRTLGLTRLVHRLPAPCPACDCMGLEREDGDDRVVCRACHGAWDEASYRRLVLILASDIAASS